MIGCILDAGSLGPDIDLQPILATLPEWRVWDATPPEATAARLADATIVLSNKVRLFAAELQSAAQLRLISVLATGTNNVDLAAAADRGITVCNVRHYSTDAVVQHTVGLMLSLATNLRSYTEAVRAGRWQTSPFFCYFDQPIVELSGRRLTIVGAGSQGRKLAAVAQALGMVVAFARRPGSSDDSAGRDSLAELLPITDVLSFHCPLTVATTRLLHRDNIFQLKKGAFVLNCARGGIVDEAALALALERGHLGGAAVDVATAEPPPLSHPLMQIKHPNFILTPHMAWATQAARQRLVVETAMNIRAFLGGERRNAVPIG